MAQSEIEDNVIFSKLEKANKQIKSNFFDLAKKTVKEGLEIDPEDEQLLITLADIEYKQGDYKKAQKILENILAKCSDSDYIFNAYQSLFFVYRELGKTRKCKKIVDFLGKEYTEHEGRFLIETQFYMYKKQYKKAYKIIKFGKQLFPESNLIASLKTELDTFFMEYKAVDFDLMNQLKENPEDEITLISAASSHLDRFDYKKCIKFAKMALVVNPFSEQAKEILVEANCYKFFLYRWFKRFHYLLTLFERLNWWKKILFAPLLIPLALFFMFNWVGILTIGVISRIIAITLLLIFDKQIRYYYTANKFDKSRLMIIGYLTIIMAISCIYYKIIAGVYLFFLFMGIFCLERYRRFNKREGGILGILFLSMLTLFATANSIEVGFLNRIQTIFTPLQ